jgi:RNA polymerase sigma-70 factor (ECF subfamily)
MRPALRGWPGVEYESSFRRDPVMLELATTMQRSGLESSFESLFPSNAETERANRASRLAEEVTALFDELRNPLLRYVLSFGLSTHDGEETIQEVFLSLFRHLRDGKPRTNLRGWTFRVAHNLGLKRRQANRKNVEHAAPMQLDPEPDPEEQLSNRQRQERLLAVVEVLPEGDRRCLYLRAEGLRYREIAEVLDMSLGAVALSLQRSLKRLSRIDGR